MKPVLYIMIVTMMSWCLWVNIAKAELDAAAQAQAYGAAHPIVDAQRDGSIIAEAEEFQIQPQSTATTCWQARNWGTNYYAATFANTFLSRKAYLSAPAQCDPGAVATRQVRIPTAGRYLVLVRYEAAYRFETQFTVRVEQDGQTVFERRYGGRDQIKIWAFRQRLQTEVAWPWGAVENIVWEGHDAVVRLQPGTATLTLMADQQPEPAAKRHIDLIMLTMDEEAVAHRLEHENYLPLDGLLTQAGDVWMRIHNQSASASETRFNVPNGIEHSPFWIHLRTWEPLAISLGAGQQSEWFEVGHLLDTLNDGQWRLKADSAEPVHYTVELGVRQGEAIESIGQFESHRASLDLAYDANTRYTNRIRLQAQPLFDLIDDLQALPVHGERPQETLIYSVPFDPKPEDATYTAALETWADLMPLTPSTLDAATIGPKPRGYIDVRHLSQANLELHLQDLQREGLADGIAVVSLGDEIGLARPPADDHEGFREWLRAQGLQPADLIPGAVDWEVILYAPDMQTADSQPALFYYSKRYQHAFGINRVKSRTDLVRQYLPHAGIGANYSPHQGHAYLGETYKWVNVFQRDAMTMPWSEDYIWQLPVGTQQMNFMNLDLFRAGIQGKPDAKIHYYVMPHWPGNTPNAWRRQFYGDLGHGMQIVNLFDFRPVQLAYTESHVNLPAMYQTIRQALYELGQFEDIVQSGRVRPGLVALWFSETADIWDDNAGAFAAGKRALYIAVRHHQLPLDIVNDAAAQQNQLAPYDVLYLTDRHVSRAGSEAIAAWVEAGGQLFATAGAGMFDEFNQPNEILQRVMGIRYEALEADERLPMTFIKQDLPYAERLDTVAWEPQDGTLEIPIFAVRQRLTPMSAQVQGRYEDGSAAITIHPYGNGQAMVCGFLPGLSYFQPAIPIRPLDRGATDDAMSHFIPTAFDAAAHALIGAQADGLVRPVSSSEPLVETSVVQADTGVVMPLVNWSGRAIENLELRVNIAVPAARMALASGQPVTARETEEGMVLRFNLDVADALIWR